MGPKKFIFLTTQARVLVVFDISRYLTDNYFDIVWGCHPPRGPPREPSQMGPPKKQFFEWLKLEFYFFLISVDI